MKLTHFFPIASIIVFAFHPALAQKSHFKSPLDTIINGNHFILNYDERKVLEGDLKNARREGLWKWYGADGKLRIQGNYRAGMKNGEWKYYYRNNKIASVVHFRNDNNFGKWEGFDSTGKRLNEKFYDQDSNLDSTYTTFYSNNRIKSITKYKNDNPTDAIAEYDSSGNFLDPGTLKNGDGTLKDYSFDGKLIGISNYKNSHLNGEFLGYYRNGNISTKGWYSNDTATGEWEYFSLDGKPKTRVNFELDTAELSDYSDTEDAGYRYVEEVMPEFPGGLNELMKFISKNVRYPVPARENGIQGKVVVQFVVNETGEIEDKKVLRDIGGLCAEEVLRLLNYMPPWMPGMQNGFAVKDYYLLPVTFKLGTDKEKKEKKKKNN